MNPTKIYQLQIALQGFKPKIWRRILLPADTLLSDFHYILQTTMGWTNSHLHQFIHGKKYYAEKAEDDDMWDELDQNDYEGIQLDALLKSVNAHMTYEYDFGDGWMHDIQLEKILPWDDTTQLPVCLDGKMHCPAEDSGGVHGYTEYLKIRLNPKHEDYESVIEWLGEDFDPDYFNLDEINERLSKGDDEWLDFDQ